MDALDENRAKDIGVRLAARGASDVTDGHVVCCAIESRATIATSDPTDINARHWPDVAHWLNEHRKARIEIDADAADLVAAMNAAFDLRDHTGRLSSGDRALVGEVLEGLTGRGH